MKPSRILGRVLAAILVVSAVLAVGSIPSTRTPAALKYCSRYPSLEATSTTSDPEPSLNRLIAACA